MGIILNKSDISYNSNPPNCIVSQPNNIRYEYGSDFSLKLLAGTTYYVPNGFNEDGSKRFDKHVLTKDLTYGYGSNTPEHEYLVCTTENGLGIYITPIENSYSLTEPTLTNGLRYFWYDKTNNVIRTTITTNWIEEKLSIPIMKISMKGTGENEYLIREVYNGFSFVGADIFVLPDVKVSIPNGFNEDGSLNNLIVTIDKVYNLFQDNLENTSTISLGYNDNNEITLRRVTEDFFNYHPSENLNYNTYGSYSGVVRSAKIGLSKLKDNYLDLFNIYSAFIPMDYNDTQYMTRMFLPSKKIIELEFLANGGVYTAPANSYLRFSKRVGDTKTQGYLAIASVSDGLYNRVRQDSYPNGNGLWGTVMLPVASQQKYTIEYNLTGENKVAEFIYANGEVEPHWRN